MVRYVQFGTLNGFIHKPKTEASKGIIYTVAASPRDSLSCFTAQINPLEVSFLTLQDDLSKATEYLRKMIGDKELSIKKLDCP